ncbi:unnamed protein product [Linum tenue]|uniref:Uncharacterized protein n=1 Tax=Linum tenue TaxID=586396 RepID=A0AAV0GTX7_9ROSI|nr:unnamed protein product [Linum tenue]
MHSLSETILQNYYYGGHHNDDGEINKKSTAIRKKKKNKGEELGWKRKGGKGRDKNHKHIWFLSCGRQQSLIDYYSVELVNGGVGGGGGDRSCSVKASAMGEDDRRDGSLSSSSSYAPSSTTTTAFATATTTATSTTMPSPDGSRGGGGGKPKKGLKRFPRVLKAILFETSLAKKIRKRKNAQKGGGNVYATTAGTVDPTKPGSEREPPIPNKNGAVELNSSTAPLAAVGSMSSTTVAGSNNSSSSVGSNLPQDAAAPGEIIQNDGKISSPTTAAGKGRYSSNVGLCLVLVSLVVLVLWGKICAIIFTSTWLFFVPRCIPGTAGSLSRIGAYYRKIEPEEYKN